MAQNIYKEIDVFKGMKDDEDAKEIPIDYFTKITNFNFQNIGISGLEKILMPARINQLSTTYVDGLFEYRFLDSSNKLQVQQIGVCNGNIYKDILSTPILIKSGLSTGKCSFAVLNDKLYIANGKNYVFVYDGINGVVSQMGAPVVIEGSIGVLTGNYYYAMTYVLAGGEEILGSVSNTVSLLNQRVELKLPIGYTGTLSRKIYRTEASGSVLKFLATISDNTTLTYTDNNSDAILGIQISDANNELPKPYFISVFQERLIGARVDLYPTQVFITDSEIDIFDLGNGIDIANYSDDNSPVSGLGIDFDNIIIGTGRHVYLLGYDSTGNLYVQTTRVNVGIKDGYSVKRVPTYGSFQGGMMFVSTNNDVRVLSGLRGIPVATSFDNIYADSFSQDVKGSLGLALASASNIYAEYFNYRYHLIVDGNKYVYDVRLGGWTYHSIQSETYKSTPVVLAVFNDVLYNGQNDGWIEQEYSEITYRTEEVPATLESAQIAVSKDYKMFHKFVYWFTPSEKNTIVSQVIGDDDRYFADSQTFDFESGAFSETDYSSSEYEICGEMDFKVHNIYKPIRWIKFILSITEGNLILRRWGMSIQNLTNKEA